VVVTPPTLYAVPGTWRRILNSGPLNRASRSSAAMNAVLHRHIVGVLTFARGRGNNRSFATSKRNTRRSASSLWDWRCAALAPASSDIASVTDRSSPGASVDEPPARRASRRTNSVARVLRSIKENRQRPHSHHSMRRWEQISVSSITRTACSSQTLRSGRPGRKLSSKIIPGARAGRMLNSRGECIATGASEALAHTTPDGASRLRRQRNSAGDNRRHMRSPKWRSRDKDYAAALPLFIVPVEIKKKQQ